MPGRVAGQGWRQVEHDRRSRRRLAKPSENTRGKKSLALRLVYQSPGRTLTSVEADRSQERLLQRLQKELGATLRG